jgi:PAS domain-containing protein
MGANEHSSVDNRSLRLRQIIDSAPALIHTARPDGYLDFFNQGWLNFVGQPLEKLLGWEWTSFIHPEDVEAFVQKWRSNRIQPRSQRGAPLQSGRCSGEGGFGSAGNIATMPRKRSRLRATQHHERDWRIALRTAAAQC